MVGEEQLSALSQEQAKEQLQQQILAAEDCQRLLSSQVVVKFFNEFEEKCFSAADNLPLNDREGRDRAYFLITLCRKFRKTLEFYAEHGIFAKEQLNELLAPSREKRSFLGGLLGE